MLLLSNASKEGEQRMRASTCDEQQLSAVCRFDTHTHTLTQCRQPEAGDALLGENMQQLEHIERALSRDKYFPISSSQVARLNWKLKKQSKVEETNKMNPFRKCNILFDTTLLISVRAGDVQMGRVFFFYRKTCTRRSASRA